MQLKINFVKSARLSVREVPTPATLAGDLLQVARSAHVCLPLSDQHSIPRLPVLNVRHQDSVRTAQGKLHPVIANAQPKITTAASAQFNYAPVLQRMIQLFQRSKLIQYLKPVILGKLQQLFFCPWVKEYAQHTDRILALLPSQCADLFERYPGLLFIGFFNQLCCFPSRLSAR